MIVYKITNKINGKSYIGQTIYTLDQRWQQHLSKRSCCRALKAAINKYGKGSFTREVMSIGKDIKDLNNAEEYFIDYFQTFGTGGYNLTTGGDSHKVSKETKELQSKVKLGKKGRIGQEGLKTLSKLMREKRKGKTPWNKGLKGVQTAWNKGIPNTWVWSKTSEGKNVRKGLGL